MAATITEATSPTSLAGWSAAPWCLLPELHARVLDMLARLAAGPKIDRIVPVRTGYQVLPGGIAEISIQGLLLPKPGFLCGLLEGTAASGVVEQVRLAIADPRVNAVLLDIDSPGGSINGIAELSSAIFAAGKIKPVVAFSSARMTSAAYWVGSAANSVYISGPTVQAGGIGVVANHNFDPAQARGTTTEITAGKYKRIATPNAPLSTEGLAYLQGQVDHLYSVFVDAVAANRGASAAAVLEHMADGRVFIGTQAIKAGLVDAMLPLGALLRELAATPEKFQNRRRIAAHRVSSNAPPFTPKTISAVPAPAVVRALTKAEIAAAAIRISHATGCNIVAALKRLGVT